MSTFSVSTLTDYSVSPDGCQAALNFMGKNSEPLSLEISTIELEKIVIELEFLLTKSRELSSLSKQGILSFLRPTTVRVSLLNDDATVVVSLRVRTGLEIHYGFEPTLADVLGNQIQEQAQKGMQANQFLRH